MDEDSIVLVLARASELRSKISNCIHSSSTTVTTDGAAQERETEDKEDEEEEEEAESLLNIRDALESLENQLSSLQALQQQQSYEKEASLAEIDYSRKKLLQKLKEYKGDALEVIREATAFASSNIDMENNDLLLPPYPTRPSRFLASDNGYLPHLPSSHKIPQNGDAANQLTGKVNKSEPRKSLKVLRKIIGVAAKTVFTIVGFVVVMNLSGFEPRVGNRGSEIRVLGMSEEQRNEEKTSMVVECPPGKIMVVENGVARCLVKERVEVPFEPVVTTPNVNYGCG